MPGCWKNWKQQHVSPRFYISIAGLVFWQVTTDCVTDTELVFVLPKYNNEWELLELSCL